MDRRRFVLLDRDGTLIEEKHYLSDPDQVALIEGAAAGLRRLAALGLGLVVVTNQSAVGRGYIDERRLEAIHRRLRQKLEAEGVVLDGLYYCPHHPEDACACRKPRTGLADRAARDHGFDPGESFVVGDLPSDLELGRALGATTLLVRTGYGAETEERGEPAPDFVVDDLPAAARLIERLLAHGGAVGRALEDR